MIRYTPTKLERIIQVFEGRIDQIVDKTCRDLDSIKSDPVTDRLNKKWMKGVREAFNQAAEAHSRTLVKQEMDRHFYQSKVWGSQMASCDQVKTPNYYAAYSNPSWVHYNPEITAREKVRAENRLATNPSP